MEDGSAAPACVQYRPGWVPFPEQVMTELQAEIEWEQLQITMFGRTLPTPRLTSWMGEEAYAYSGLVNEPKQWPPALLRLRQRLVDEFSTPFNSCLANLYRGGSDSMGYHSDDEPELGERPTIASVSLGARRTFSLRHRVSRQRWSWELGQGDLLLMTEESQSDYAHAVPKTTRLVGPRLNLTFRVFRSPGCRRPPEVPD